jgi:L-fuconate dehydratase
MSSDLIITRVEIRDVRFDTSRELDGSDAMNKEPDYSSALTILHTSNPDLQGVGLTFTIGRGNEVVCAGIKAFAPMVEGKKVSDFTKDMGAFWKLVASDSQLRWIGPECGAQALAQASFINAMWDLYAKIENKPLWKLLIDMTPEQLVSVVDFRYITDAITKEEALEFLRAQDADKEKKHARIQQVLEKGMPAYTTSAGWLGYPESKIRQKCREAIAEGFNHIKIKVGRDLEDDKRRLKIVREEIGPDRGLMIDANQVWDVEQAILWTKELAKVTNLFWIEEPTSPVDVIGHQRIAKELKGIVPVATGEHCQNRIVFKQLMQTNAIGYCQIDCARMGGGVGEVIASFLLAKKFNIPVCQHAGGTLCELVSHMAIWDFVCLSGTTENRLTEFVDHLHEHFLDPSIVKNAHYLAPMKSGYLVGFKQESIEKYSFPDGPVWKAKLAQKQQ